MRGFTVNQKLRHDANDLAAGAHGPVGCSTHHAPGAAAKHHAVPCRGDGRPCFGG